MRSTARVTDALRGRKKVVAYVGTAAALLGAGTASAATVTSTAHTPAAAHAKAAARTTSVVTTAAHRTADRTGRAKAATRRAAAKAPAKAKDASWSQIVKTVAKVSPGTPAAANELQPVAPAGTQAWMPISGAQLANATTIVKQAYAKKMGVRSAVIAVATAMQESTLSNISYGTSDSVGLFQQRPSCGWGTVQQIMDPAYAADAFLTALHQHQAGDPGWASQPLWANAQAVQASGFPFAYAKWETQAAHLVKQITTQLR